MEGTKLNILFSEKAGLLIISFVGPLIWENRAELDDALQRLKEYKVKWTILYVRDVPPKIDKSMIPKLAQFQRAARDIPSDLRVASMHPELRNFLLVQGVIRTKELVDNLQEAIESLAIKTAQ